VWRELHFLIPASLICFSSAFASGEELKAMECEPVNAHTTFALTLLCIASGCGTLANLNGQSYPLMGGTEPTKPLGGVRRDIGWITSVTAPVNLLFVADLPVSLIGDVVTQKP
jgi:hypothetical protein